MRSTFLTFLFCAAVALGGCSGQPSEGVGQKILERRVESQSGARIKLVGFRKTNATLEGNRYLMEYEAEVMFLWDGTWTRGGRMDSSVSFEFTTERQPNNNIAQLMGNAIGAVNVKRDEKQTFKGVLRFEKTENGWRGEDGQVY